MIDFVLLAAILLLFGVIAWAYLKSPDAQRKPRVLPPPRSKSTEPTYEQRDSVASLFLETVALIQKGATWPALLDRLNPDDQPRIRTLLLELRAHNARSPREVLHAIEITCIESKPESESLTRGDLLERARVRLETKELNE
jgi:hypothetical protein